MPVPRPDLTLPRRRVSALMSDRILITHWASGGVLADTIDRTTGALVAPGGGNAPTTVYDDPITPGIGGLCIIKSGQGSFTDESGNPTELELYELLLPWDANVPVPGDLGTIRSSVRDQSLVNKILTITSIERGTFLIARKLHAVEYEAAAIRLTGGGGGTI